MQYTTLPTTSLKVSKLCLGTMTFGNQNSEAEGHEQLRYAVNHGINFIDTAELYPVPAEARTQGKTSEIIGTWLQKNGNRDKLVIATKIAGPGDYTTHIRTTDFVSSINDAIDAELKRLQTDYIDLYQLHWPERQTNFFSVRGYTHNNEEEWKDNFNAILHSLENAVKAGKIRYIGVSNERSWGVMRYLEESKICDLPRMITIQNPYSLLNRTFESDLAEVSHREQIGLLAYSPMAFGVLSGKYIKNTAADNSRLKLFPRFARYSSEQSTEATRRYLQLADQHNITLAQMALAFVTQRPFVTSTIIGATTLEQLQENIESIDITLSDTILSEIETIHSCIPNPAPYH